MRGNGRVVSRRACVHFCGQLPPQLQRGVAAGLDLLGDRGVVGRVHNHRHAVVIFRRASQHRRPADVNVLNGVVQRDVRFGDRGLERVEIHHHEINGCDVVVLHGCFVLRVAPDVKQPAVDFRVQRLHPAIEHFRETGVLADVLYREARLPQGFSRSAGRNEFHPDGGQGLSERDQPVLVRNRQQCARNLHHVRKESERAPRRVNRQSATARPAAVSWQTCPVKNACSPRVREHFCKPSV
jgi:hypothetical protein